ncbi:putative flippase [Mucinivorans hirudinis]|uniref:Putative flippase n=1 Tax=Mucinivorans hirudinis TaxID=1433126 RepID=A0A060RBL1_9BACT|nr:putative flippase [Mucinivorans hirudinis]
MLYARQLFSLVVSLFTAGIVLRELGVEDYGVYNVVGGVVALFGFLQSSMATGTQRFMNVEMGRGNLDGMQKVFSTSLTIHIAIAVVIFILAQTLGLWLVNYGLVIPHERMFAANVVYQFSVIGAMLTITQTPYSAAIIAHEKMGVYGYLGIAQTLMGLIILYLLVKIRMDKLILYSMLVFAVGTIFVVLYRIYCVRKFAECRFRKPDDRALYREMLGFSGWNLFGGLVSVANNQGQNVLLNLFFGTVINAARGVAVSLNNAVQQFVSNFMVATNPQITKCYVAQDYSALITLVFRSAKFSFFLLLILASPVLIQTQYILELWLKTPPEFASIFAQLTIINTLIVCVSSPLMTVAQASGKLKRYIGGLVPLTLLNLPLSYLFLKLGYSPMVVYVINITIDFIAYFRRLYLVSTFTPISFWGFTKSVFVRCWLIFVVALLPQFLLIRLFEQSVLLLVTSSLASVAISCSVIFALGMTRDERIFIMNAVMSKMKRR